MPENFELYLNKTNFDFQLKNLKEKIGEKKVLFYGAGSFFEYINSNYDLKSFNIIGISDKKFDENNTDENFLSYKIIPVLKINENMPDYILVSTIKNNKLVGILKNDFNNCSILPLAKENEEAYTEFFSIENIKTKLEKCNFFLKNYDQDKKEALFSNGKLNILTDIQYPWIVYEIFLDNIYNLATDLDKTIQYNVIDIGANRCYASLYFAQKDYVKSIYAFELVKKTADFAKRVLKLNSEFANKITLYEFGLGKKDEEVTIYMLPHRDGCNTFSDAFFDSHMPEERGRGIPEVCEVKKASDILKIVVNDNNLEHIILKVDAEGAEYDIFEDLKENYPEIFDKVDIIVGDAHLGFERFCNLLPMEKFKIAYANKQPDGCCPFELAKI